MAITSSSTGSQDSKPAQENGTSLRLTTTLDPDSDVMSTPPSSYSSLQQSAIALVTVASEQAVQHADDIAANHPACPRQLLNERREHAVQRANAEQARRVSECMRGAVEALVRHMMQPCFGIDETDRIVRWNAAMENWAGIAQSEVVGQPISLLFEDDATASIEAASQDLRAAEALDGDQEKDPVFVLKGSFRLRSGRASAQVSLLPLRRQPGIVEAILVLLTPGEEQAKS